MIQQLRVRNFLSLRDTVIKIEPLNIFVGPNGAGKSAIFKALITLSRLLHQPIRTERGDFQIGSANFDTLVREGNENLPICFDVWFDAASSDPQYSVEIRKLGIGWSVTAERFLLPNLRHDSETDPLEHGTERKGSIIWELPYGGTLPGLLYKYRNDTVARERIAPFLALSDMIGSTWRYRPSPSMMAETVYPPSQDNEGRVKEVYVGETGWGLPFVLNRQLGREREVFLSIEKQLMKWFPHITSIDFESARQGIRISFRTTRSQKPIPAELESDGVLMALFLLWRLHARETNVNICLEEPENSTHPFLLQDRYNYIRDVTSSPAFGNARLLIATHSPDFLEAVGAKDALRTVQIVEYSSRRGTIVTKLSDLAEVDKLFEIFRGNIGELWWSGAIGGVPKNN